MKQELTTPPQSAPALRAYLWLLVAVTGALLLYALLTWLFWLSSWIPTPRTSIGTVTKNSASGTMLLVLIGITLYTLYVLGALILWWRPVFRQQTQLIWTGAIAASMLLLWAYPVTSTDVFDYFFRSRMAVTYDANPYLALPNQFKSDPFLRYIGWPNAPSAYGPLWEYLSYGSVWLGGDSLLRNVLLYKALAAITHLVCGLLIGTLVTDARTRTLSVYLWLFSPLALWELVAVGHNDGLMIITLLLALVAVRHDRYWLAVLALTGGALIKFLPAIFLPLVVLAWLRSEPTWWRRGRALVLASLLFCVPVGVLYAPFWDLPPAFASLPLDAKLMAIWQGRTTTLHNLAVREGFLNASPLAVVSYLLQTDGSLRLINSVMQALTQPIAEQTDVQGAVSSFGTILLGLSLLWQCWHIWFRRRPLVSAFLGLLLWYVLVSSQWFQPWYIVWILAIFALRPTFGMWIWLTAWALMAQASYLLQYIVLPTLKLGGQTLEAQALYVVVIYTLPLALWLWTTYWRTNQPSGATEQQPAVPQSVVQ